MDLIILTFWLQTIFARGNNPKMASIGVSLVTGAAAYNIAGSSILAAATTAQHVLEIVVTLTSNGDLDTATDGTELLKALSTSATAAATQITVDSAGSAYLVAYQDGNAYLYAIDAVQVTQQLQGETTPVSVIEGILQALLDKETSGLSRQKK